MTARPLVVVGGGEHARVVIDAAGAAPSVWRVVGFTDPTPGERTANVTGVARLGDDDVLLARLASADPNDRPWLVLGIGLPGGAARRQAIVSQLDADWAVVVHPASSVSPAARLGAGSVVLAGAVVNPGATVGCHAIVNSRAVIEHDVTLGDRVHIAPGAVIGGGSAIGEDAFVGLGALVRDHVTVGAGATVGMGAVVVADVPARAVVVGNPARVIRRD